ncbi:MAG: sulfatase-like hydrolase/transferase [Patescibacteria group bacterium]
MEINMKRFRIGLILGFLILIPLSLSAYNHFFVSDKAIYPNIIIIIADDLSPNMISINGIPDNPWIENSIELKKYSVPIETPNLEKIANEGIYFNKTYLPLPSCVPSRASLLTGKMPTATGIEDNNGKFDVTRNQNSISSILKSLGYSTHFIGKCNLGGRDYYEGASSEGKDMPAKKDLREAQALYHFLSDQKFDDVLLLNPDAGWIPDWYNYTIARNGNPEEINIDKFPSLDINEQRQKTYVTNFFTNEALDIIQNTPEKEPFFIWLAHVTPHAPHYGYEDEKKGLPNNLPPETREAVDEIGEKGYKYSINEIPDLPNVYDDLSTKPIQQLNTYPYKIHQANKTDTSRRKRVAYEMVDNLDSQVGRIMNKLEETGKLDNTIIIFLSDNGLMFGEHGMYLKGPMMYDELTRSPLLIKYPASIDDHNTTDWVKGTNSSLISSIDIAPTILDMLGSEKPEEMQGESFFDLISGNKKNHNTSVLIEFENWLRTEFPIRAVVTDSGYKFVHYYPSVVKERCAKALGLYSYCLEDATSDGFDYELYNLNKDPFEMNNSLARNNKENVIRELFGSYLDNKQIISNQNKLTKKQKELIYIGKEMGKLQTSYKDPRGITFENISQEGDTIHFTTNMSCFFEVNFKQKDCEECKWEKITYFDYGTNHSFANPILESSDSYSIRIYAITLDINGGLYEYET